MSRDLPKVTQSVEKLKIEPRSPHPAPSQPNTLPPSDKQGRKSTSGCSFNGSSRGPRVLTRAGRSQAESCLPSGKPSLSPGPVCLWASALLPLSLGAPQGQDLCLPDWMRWGTDAVSLNFGFLPRDSTQVSLEETVIKPVLIRN